MGSASPLGHRAIPHYASPIERHHASPRQHGTPRHHPSPLLRAQSAPRTTHRPRPSEVQIPSPSPSRAVLLAGTYPSPPNPTPPRPAGTSPPLDEPLAGTAYASADLASAEVRLSREAYAGADATALRDANSAIAWASPVAPPPRDGPAVPRATEKLTSTGEAEADVEAVDADTAYAALCARFGGDLSVEHLAALPREQVQALSAVLHDRHTTM